MRAFEFIFEDSFLVEDRIDFLRQKMIPLLIQAQYVDPGDEEQVQQQEATDLFNWVVEQDPDPKKSHVQWLFNLILRKKNPQPIEDLQAAKDALTNFMEMRKQRQLVGQQADINSYKSVRDLEQVVGTAARAVQTATDAEKDKALKESHIVYKDSDVTVIQPTTEYAACYWGAETEWCTAWGYPKGKHPTRTNMFKSYANRGPIYVLEPTNPQHEGERYQIQISTNQFMDEHDRNIGLKAIAARFPNIVNFLIETISDEDPEEAYNFIKAVGFRVPELEGIIAESPQYSYLYATHILNNRFPYGEPAILTNAYYAELYAENVIGGRWPEAEKIIADDPEYAYRYALNVIEGRWPEAEPRIADLAEWSYRYAVDILDRDRFERGEKAIVADPEWAGAYIDEVLGGDPTVLLPLVDQEKNTMVIFMNNDRLQLISDKIAELCRDKIYDVLSDWESNDDYYYSYLQDEGYADEDGDIDWDRVENDKMGWLDYNDDARHWLKHTERMTNPTPDEIREMIQEDGWDYDVEIDVIPDMIAKHMGPDTGATRGDHTVYDFLRNAVIVGMHDGKINVYLSKHYRPR